MPKQSESLSIIFEGWNGYNQSIVNALQPLTREQLIWRPQKNFNSVGELARHISLGRITWFMRMHAPGSLELASQVPTWETDSDGNRDIANDSLPITEQPEELVRWLALTWQMIEATLTTWNVNDLSQTYEHTWNGKKYSVSRQWTIWRILNHDLHHGGELSLMLGLQGIESFELSGLLVIRSCRRSQINKTVKPQSV